MKPIVFICPDKDWIYFEDYFSSFSKYIHILRYVTINETPLSSDIIYMFVLDIPQWVISQHSQKKISIVYMNTEQLTKPDREKQVSYYLSNDIMVIDYDYYQSQWFHSLHHFYLPVLPTSLEKWVIQPKRHQVGICAILASERRLRMCQLLYKHGIDVINIHCWREERDSLLGQCQIIINIHYDTDYNIFEHLRCDRWIMSGAIVLSETSINDDSLDIKPLLFLSSYDNMLQTVVHMLQKYEHIVTEQKQKCDLYLSDIIKKRYEQCEHVVKTLNEL